MQQRPRQVKRNITNLFGSFGYIFCFFQWLWAAMLYFAVIQSVALFTSSPTDRQVEQSSSSFTFVLPNPLEMIIIITVTIAMAVLTVYVLVRIPADVAKTSHKMVDKTTKTIVPIIIKSRHKKDTKKARARITSKLVLVIKLLLITLPIVLTALSGLLENPAIDYTIAMIVGGGLAGFGMASFVAQYLLANLFHVKTFDLW